MRSQIIIVTLLLFSATLFAITPEDILSRIDKNRDYGTISYTATWKSMWAAR